MSALTVFVIRHAEKPGPIDPGLGPGLTAKGMEDKHSLVIRGWQRAGTWAALFGAGTAGPDFPKPNIVYAANPAQSSSRAGSHSKRPFETIAALCNRLRLSPITAYGVDDEIALVNEVQ